MLIFLAGKLTEAGGVISGTGKACGLGGLADFAKGTALSLGFSATTICVENAGGAGMTGAATSATTAEATETDEASETVEGREATGASTETGVTVEIGRAAEARLERTTGVTIGATAGAITERCDSQLPNKIPSNTLTTTANAIHSNLRLSGCCATETGRTCPATSCTPRCSNWLNTWLITLIATPARRQKAAQSIPPYWQIRSTTATSHAALQGCRRRQSRYV